MLDRHAAGRRLLRVGLTKTGDVNRSVTWRQWCKIEGMCHPAPCDAPNPFLAAVFVFVGASSKTPSVVGKLGHDHDIGSPRRAVTVDVYCVVGGGMLHDREGPPLLLHGGANSVESNEYPIRAGFPRSVRCPDRLPADTVSMIGTHAVVVGQAAQCELGLDPIEASREVVQHRHAGQATENRWPARAQPIAAMQTSPLYRTTESHDRVLHRPGLRIRHRSLPDPPGLDSLPMGHTPPHPMTYWRTL
ncbi:hypothetical protein OK074_6177 [Actinobacteria bacterium OK074]|nr:hypothetical protein OK074_6177 [Actinobacteria bacterium OK074]